MHGVLRSGVVAMALLFAPVLAVAQQENLASPEQKAQQERAQQSKDGQLGTREPSSEQNTPTPDPTAVFANGRLAVPGAPADSQTVPSLYSQRNATLDALPTMAFQMQLTDEQRRRIRESLNNANAPVQKVVAQPAQQLPNSVPMRPVPDELVKDVPAVSNLYFVRTPDRILLITGPNRIVVDEIPT